MEEQQNWKETLRQMLNDDLIQMTLSGSKDADRAGKVKIRPVLLKGELMFQETLYRGTQVFHKNFTTQEMFPRLTEYMEILFRQAQIQGTDYEAVILVSRKGKVTVKKKKAAMESGNTPKRQQTLSHNRTKKYILPEGEPVDFLVGLGV